MTDEYAALGLNIYLAARYSRREELCSYKDDLLHRGHRVPARWLLGNHAYDPADLDRWENTDEKPEDVARRFATDDIEDLEAASLLVNFTEPPRSGASRGGRHVELGYALGRGRHKIIVVGPIENVFHALPDVMRFDTWTGFLDVFDRLPPRCGEVSEFRDGRVGPCPLHYWHRHAPISGGASICTSPFRTRQI